MHLLGNTQYQTGATALFHINSQCEASGCLRKLPPPPPSSSNLHIIFFNTFKTHSSSGKCYNCCTSKPTDLNAVPWTFVLQMHSNVRHTKSNRDFHSYAQHGCGKHVNPQDSTISWSQCNIPRKHPQHTWRGSMNAIPLTKGISHELLSPPQPAISEPQICGTVAQ